MSTDETSTPTKRDWPVLADLYDYDTAELIREATADELAESAEAAERDGGAGVILVPDQGDRRCYVI